MDSAITDLQKWREIRNRELALELDCMGPTGEGQWQAAPETDEGEGQAAAVPLGEGVDDSIGDSEGKTHYRHADDKAVSAVSLDSSLAPRDKPVFNRSSHSKESCDLPGRMQWPRRTMCEMFLKNRTRYAEEDSIISCSDVFLSYCPSRK